MPPAGQLAKWYPATVDHAPTAHTDAWLAPPWLVRLSDPYAKKPLASSTPTWLPSQGNPFVCGTTPARAAS